MAIALVGTPQGAIATPGQVASLSTVTGMDITGASLLIVAVHYLFSGTAGNFTVSSTSNPSGNWHSLTAYGASASNGFTQIFYCYGPATSSSEIFTITQTANSDYWSMNCAAFSGTFSTSDILQAGSDVGAVSSGGVASFQPGSVTPSVTGALVITTLTGGGGLGVSFSVDSAMANAAPQFNGNGVDGGLAYLIDSTTNPINPTWTLSSSSESMTASIAIFLPSGLATFSLDDYGQVISFGLR